MSHTLLVIDDDSDILSALKMMLRTEGFQVICAESTQEGLACLARQSVDLVLTDLNFSLDTTSGEEGIALIKSIREKDDETPIIVMTGWGTIDVAVSTMQKGANDFIQKPWENNRLIASIENQLKYASALKKAQKLDQQNQILNQSQFSDTQLISESKAMQSVMAMVKKVALSDVNVLITGENGTGKSLLAKCIHKMSRRQEESFVSVNMGAVTESLFESEMFGHTKGAFTDAKQARIGRFELADGGTLFLDEIANTPYTQQGKLLRVLEENQFEKVGASLTQSVDIRLISATNANLAEMIESSEFRKDLFYRINTIEIEVPALKNRREDIVPLAKLFLSRIAEEYCEPKCELDQSAQQALTEYDWPGNVRELNHVMQRAQILSNNRLICAADLGISQDTSSNVSSTNSEQGENKNNATLEDIERKAIEERLRFYQGNALKTAESLGLSRSAFYRRMEKLGISSNQE